jgi:hypothetical protein
MNTREGETSTLKTKVTRFTGWSSSLFMIFILDEWPLWLSSKVSLSWKCFTSSKCSQVWFKLVFGAAKIGWLSWYQKAEFSVGSHMGSQEIPYCNVTRINLGRGSPINSGNWIVLVSSSIFDCCFQRIIAMKCSDNFVIHSRQIRFRNWLAIFYTFLQDFIQLLSHKSSHNNQ